MTRQHDKRVSGIVLLVAATAVAVAAGIPSAGALDALDGAVAVATSVVEAADGGTTPDAVDAVTGSSTSTSTTASTSTTTTTTTTTVAPTTSTTTPEPVASPTQRPGRADLAVTTSPPASVPPPPASPVEAPAQPVPDRVDLGTPAALDELDALPLSSWPAALPLRAGPRSTVAIIGILRDLDAPPALVATVLAPFPVAGPATYSDDWGAPRHGPPAHLHQGTDVFAERGTPVIASADGAVSGLTTTGPLGGTSLRLTASGGTFYYYAHLDRFAPGLASGDQVSKGAVLGFVGNTGNARTTPPHLHYEIHPGGGLAVPPVPYLDRWLAEAATAVGAIRGAPSAQAVLRPVVARRPMQASAGAALPPGTQGLEMRSVDAKPASAVNALPVLSAAVPLGALSFLAHRGKKRARRRVAGSA